MVILRGVELGERDDFGDDGGFAFGLGAGLRFVGYPHLVVVFRQDDRAVLRASVGTLTIEGGRVMRLPEKIDDLFVGNLCRVVLYLHHLGMAGFAGPDFLVGRILGLPAGVAGHNGDDAGEAFVNGFDAPEASSAEGGCFSFHGFGIGLEGYGQHGANCRGQRSFHSFASGTNLSETELTQ